MTFNPSLLEGFDWSTPFIADACMLLGLPLRTGPKGLRPLTPGTQVAGRAVPAKHAGSVDVFLEAIAAAARGDVLVIDNNGRLDEGCIGDLVAGEALMAGLAGILVDGAHRDSAAIQALGIPIWSRGAYPVGPRELHTRAPHALQAATFGSATVTRDDVVFADADGGMVVGSADVVRVIEAARDIAERERAQAERLLGGERLAAQLQLDAYVARRRHEPALTFREHLKTLGGAIEI